jgi:hypothetical protein
MNKRKRLTLCFVICLLITSASVAAFEKKDVSFFPVKPMYNSLNTHNFNNSIILAASQDDYVAAIPLATKYQLPLILVSEPFNRIEYFIELYNPMITYEIGDTIFDAISLTENDLEVESDETLDDYVVIAKKNGEFSIVGEYLASLHHGRIIYAENLEDPVILEELKQINPTYCALVWNPDEFECHAFVKTKIWFTCSICQSTMPQFLLDQLTRLDDDPYIDVSFGFITGSDVTDASLLLAREMVYEELIGNWKDDALFSPGRSNAQDFCEEFELEYLGKNDNDYNAQVFVDSIKNGVKYACFFGHGNPLTLLFDTSSNANAPDATSLISCPQFYQYLKEKGKNVVYLPDDLTIKPTIFIMEACLTGLTGMLYDSISGQSLMYECNDLRNHSIALKMIKSGAAAYIGSSTIGGVDTAYPYLMASAYNWSLGDIVTHKNNKFISQTWWLIPTPLYIYKYDPRVVLFGDPLFTPSLPIETTDEDFYDIETVEKLSGGFEQTSVVKVKHLKEDIDISFGKVEISRKSADKGTGFQLSNKVICKNNIYNMNERVYEQLMGHRIEEDHGSIYLSWDVNYPEIGGNTLNILVTPERPIWYSIEE